MPHNLNIKSKGNVLSLAVRIKTSLCFPSTEGLWPSHRIDPFAQMKSSGG